MVNCLIGVGSDLFVTFLHYGLLFTGKCLLAISHSQSHGYSMHALCYGPLQEPCLCWPVGLELSSTVHVPGITIPLTSPAVECLKTILLFFLLLCITLSPTLFCFLCSDSVWNPFFSYSFIYYWHRSGIPLYHWMALYKFFVTISICYVGLVEWCWLQASCSIVQLSGFSVCNAVQFLKTLCLCLHPSSCPYFFSSFF